MIKRGPAITCHERALSEVIGFVLILGIITAAFSLYLVYGVPAQGRESEILHMNDIKDQFVSYKIGVDSLWTNQQKNIAMSTSFPLGTGGQTTQGSNSIIPILQPVGSSGTLGINQRTATPESLRISSTSYIISNTGMFISDSPIPITTTQTTHTYPTPPTRLLINLQTKSQYSDMNTGSLLISGSNWSATVGITPNIAECLNYTVNTTTSATSSTVRPNCNGTDMTITIVKNGIKSLDKSIIYSNVNRNMNYSINLFDPAYGLQSVITYPETITFSGPNMNNISATTATAQYAYQQQTNYNYSVPLGALTYNAKNNYWIPQSYYYQMGGVFLSQSDGITYKLPPEITFLNNGNGNISVNVVAIAYDQSNSGVVGGNSPAQVSTSLKSDSGTLPYAAISPNTWSTKISILTPDPNAATMWLNYLNASANQTGGIPHNYYRVDSLTNGSYIEFNSANWTSDGNPHISLNVKTANLSTSVHGVGGSLQ
jgi:hypothetical protein